MPAPPSGGFKCPWKKKEEREEGGGSGGGGGVKKILNRLGGGGGSADADGAAEAEVGIEMTGHACLYVSQVLVSVFNGPCDMILSGGCNRKLNRNHGTSQAKPLH